jgi:hypothetical protein
VRKWPSLLRESVTVRELDTLAGAACCAAAIAEGDAAIGTLRSTQRAATMPAPRIMAAKMMNLPMLEFLEICRPDQRHRNPGYRHHSYRKG